jgi:hypothetical protein
MGHHFRSEALFDYFRLEDQVPETHLWLRLIEKRINFAFVREKLKDSYRATAIRAAPGFMSCASETVSESRGPQLRLPSPHLAPDLT